MVLFPYLCGTSGGGPQAVDTQKHWWFETWEQRQCSKGTALQWYCMKSNHCVFDVLWISTIPEQSLSCPEG